MSWNKNTYDCSEIDSKIEMLEEFDIPYKLKIITSVIGMGLNDHYSSSGKIDYPIRILKFKDKIFIEQMIRTYDCDSDDMLRSLEIKEEDISEKFPLEIYTNWEEYAELDEGDVEIIPLSFAPKEENFINLKEILNDL